jgi:hypothetical protein
MQIIFLKKVTGALSYIKIEKKRYKLILQTLCPTTKAKTKENPGTILNASGGKVPQ